MNISLPYFIITTIFYCSLLTNPNNKTLLVYFFIYFIVVFRLVKNFRTAILLTYIAALPLNNGKEYSIELVPAAELNIPLRPYGIITAFYVSLKEILTMIMALVLFKDILQKGLNKLRALSFLPISLFVYFISVVVATMLGSIRREISLIHAAYFIQPFIFFLFLQSMSFLKRENKTILAIFCAALVFLFFLTTRQFLLSGPTGSSLEVQENFSVDDSLDAGASFYRPAGTFSHANWLAHYVLPYAVLFFPTLFLTFPSVEVGNLTFFLTMATLLLTTSRSAWLSVFLSTLVVLFVAEKKWNMVLRLRLHAVRTLIICIPALLLFGFYYIIPRVINTLYSFQLYGSGYSRNLLTKEAIDTILQNPLFGVGLGMDSYYAYTHSLYKTQYGIYSYFPEAVHNGFLSLVVQVGLFPMVIYLIIFGFLTYQMIMKIRHTNNNTRRLFYLSALAAPISQLINGFFVPSLADLNIFLLFYMMYV